MSLATYRQTHEMNYDQLVLPKIYRQGVLEIAHSIPMAGHLGKDKTAQWILRRFYWPTLFRDVAEYVRSCTAYQITPKHGKTKAPLIPLPIDIIPKGLETAHVSHTNVYD